MGQKHRPQAEETESTYFHTFFSFVCVCVGGGGFLQVLVHDIKLISMNDCTPTSVSLFIQY
jgi:hypothetical protein